MNLEFVSLTQLAIHDIRVETLAKYRFSYFLSWAVISVIIIELLRAWEIVRKKGVSVEKLSEENFELGMIKKKWVGELCEEEQSEGNIFMIIDKLRWSSYQILLIGLQKNYVLQVCLMVLIQIVYTISLIIKLRRKRFLESIAATIQTCVIEVAVFVFLGILTYFAFNQNDDFYESSTSKNMQKTIFVAVLIAVCAQAISVLWNIYQSAKEFISKKCGKKEKSKTEAGGKEQNESDLNLKNKEVSD